MNAPVTRHWIFLGMLVVVLVSMLINFRPDLQPSIETRRMFSFVDSLPTGSTILVSFDHEASSLPEIRPLAIALLRHIFNRGDRVIGMALMAEGTVIGYRLLEQTAKEYGRQYGRDYVYLGFKPQNIAAILSLGESFSKTFSSDYLGTPLEEIPMLGAIHDYKDVASVISIADGNMPTYWIEYGGARFHVTVCSAMTAAMMTTFDPYVASGQLHSLVGGLRGAAEYETLIGIGGGGGRGMLAQAAAHWYVLALIIAGNVIYYLERRKARRS